jgi:hypothetical protein
MSTIKADTLSNLLGTLSVPVATAVQGSAKAWVNFNGTGTVAIRASFNVSSITDNGTGDYTINFTTAMQDANYSLVGVTQFDQSGGTASAYLMGVQIANITAPLSASSARIWGRYGVSTTLYDQTTVCVSVFR